MQIEKIEQTGPYLVIAGSLMHIFCCGIPLFLSLTNLTAIFGLSTLGSFELEWFERIEPYVLFFSGIILLLTFAGYFFAKWRKPASSCDETCTQNNNFSEKLLYAAAFLYAINLLTIFLSTPHH